MSALDIRALILSAQEAAAEALNALATEVYVASQAEVPEAFEHDPSRYDPPVPSLKESGRYPGNDPELAAKPGTDFLEAWVIYDSPYAMIQHEGMGVINRNGGTVFWEAHNYTKPGAKKKYLEDPYKAVLPQVEERVAMAWRARLKEMGL